MKRITAFKWTILRPGRLSKNSGEGKVDAGRTHLGRSSFTVTHQCSVILGLSREFCTTATKHMYELERNANVSKRETLSKKIN